MEFIQQSVELLGIAPSSEYEMLQLIERAGRTCYKSEERITKNSCVDFFKMIFNRGHFSVLSHSNIVFRLDFLHSFQATELIRLFRDYLYEQGLFYFRVIQDRQSMYIAGSLRSFIDLFYYETGELQINEIVKACKNGFILYFPVIADILDITISSSYSVSLVPCSEQLNLFKDYRFDLPVVIFKVVTDRGISHEIVRHSTLAFSQESSRYVNYTKDRKGIKYITPYQESLTPNHEIIYHNIEEEYNLLIQEGVKRDFARNVLPNALKTEIVISGRLSYKLNDKHIQGFYKFFKMRCAADAHPRIREIAETMKSLLEEKLEIQKWRFD